MKICVTSQASNLDSLVDPRFGRCAYFIIYDTETDKFEAVENPHVGEGGGVGIRAAELVASKGAKVVLTGNIGPNATQTLQTANIDIVSGITGNVKEAIENYKKGGAKGGVESKPAAAKQEATPQVSSMGRGLGAGRGRGGGRGMGRGGFGAGPGGFCVCPRCGEKVVHQPGIACRAMYCPKCNTRMVRE
ncbi:MAG: hypothetical protein AMJ43_03150 [Coxiella sp. DG_40]|nr:MAG: hypothetical protein AMJ43_03150 [Coxiella sp. DG_40]